MINVQLSHPNGARQEILLAGVPRAGEGIRTKTQTPNEPPLVVEYIIWTEGGTGGDDPEVIAVVKPREPRKPDVA